MTVVAVLGLGNMGGAIAANLLERGFALRGFDLSSEALAVAVSKGALPAVSAGEAVRGADAVITSLPTPEAVRACYQEVVAVAAGRVFIDVSTVDPQTSAVVEGEVRGAGGQFVACPLGKGPLQAAHGESPLFIGGTDDAVAAAEEVLDAIGGTRHVLGTVEAATTFKIVSNMIAFANLGALCEGYVMARAAGLSDDAFVAALADTGGMSYQAALRLPWIADRDFSPRFAVGLACKDLRLGVDLAARHGRATPVASAALQLLALAMSHGLAERDAAAIVSVLMPQLSVQQQGGENV